MGVPGSAPVHEPPKRPTLFIIVVVVVSVVAAFIVGYLGINGTLGGGFPGQSKPPPSDGSSGSTFHLTPWSGAAPCGPLAGSISSPAPPGEG